MLNINISLAVLILTYNEEVNLPYLLKSLTEWVSEIHIVDSGSTDKTLEIANSSGANIKYHPWKTYADQFNWGLENMNITTDWIMRMDADEIVTSELAKELITKLPGLSDEVTGLYVKRRVYFGGRWIRYGGYYPTWLLRIFRYGKGQCENRWMDEHIVLAEGETRRLKHDIIDENRKGLSFWVVKHDTYAHREMRDLLQAEAKIPLEKPNAYGPQESSNALKATLIGGQDQRKRWIKGNVYRRCPLFWRAAVYYFYRYFILCGFLDGTPGLIFHFLQGFWYRFYIDAIIWEHYYLERERSK